MGYGTSEAADVRLVDLRLDTDGAAFFLEQAGSRDGPYRSPLAGQHNALNAAGAISILRGLGVPSEDLAAGLSGFAGVRRRQEVRGVASGVRVIDDFAHHPTEVRETLRGLRARYPEGLLWAVFEPRSNTSRTSRFQDEFHRALGEADRVVLARPHRFHLMTADERLDTPALAAALGNGGTPARAIDEVDDIVRYLVQETRATDTVAILSNGGFGGIHDKLLSALETRPIP